jgi:hypothetical protein
MTKSTYKTAAGELPPIRADSLTQLDHKEEQAQCIQRSRDRRNMHDEKHQAGIDPYTIEGDADLSSSEGCIETNHRTNHSK